MRWIIKVILYGLALMVTDQFVSGFEISGFEAAIIAGLILGIINTIIRPILIFLTLPITFFTLGLFILLINALTFALTSKIVDGFEIYSISGAFWGALFTGLVSWIFNSLANKDK